MKRSFYLKTKILLGFGLVITAIVLTSIIAYSSYEQLSHSVQILSRQDTRLQQIDSILFMVNQSENRLQEYTIEKSADKLRNYDGLVSDIRQRVQQLKKASTLDDSSLDAILNLINAKLVSMDEFIKIREQRDDFRFYDKALKQLEEKHLAEAYKESTAKEITSSPLPEDPEPVRPDEEEKEASAQSEEKEKEKGWFKNIIDKIFKNEDNRQQEDTTLVQPKQEMAEVDVLPGQDTLFVAESKTPNVDIDSVRHMLRKLKSEQATTEEYLNQQELAYLGTNARVMDRIYELIAEVKLQRQREYAQQSQEARMMLQTSLSRLGVILLIALGSTFLFVYFIFADIAKSDFLKQQLEQAKHRAEQLARIKEDFLANMSHEIRTPLTAILGFTSLLKQGRLSGKQPEYVSALDSSSSHLLSLVNDILDFSKIEAGQLRFETEAFDMILLIEQVCVDMRTQAEKKDLQLILQAEGEQSRFVRGDAFRLKQVLYNLISNAIKFTEEGGIIIRARLKPLDDHVISARMEVIDSGIGIPQEKQRHIFDAFVQSDVSDTRKYGGTGLGLSISKRIIEAQGGEISLESSPGEGTTFYIILPLLKAEASALATQAQHTGEQLSFPGLQVLVIDDDPLNTQLLSAMLQGRGASCLTAGRGQEGLDILQSEKVDLILTDLQMPEMPGEEVAAAVRKMGIEAVPVIAFTARVTEQRGYFKQKGFDDVLYKPFKEEDVTKLLQEYAAHFVQQAYPASSRPLVSEVHDHPGTKADELYCFDNIRRFIGDDQESLLLFLENFLKGLRESIQKIETALSKGDAQTVEYHVHRLFPNVTQLQLAELPALLRKIEHAAQSGLAVDSMAVDIRQALVICRQLEVSLSARQESLKAQVG